MHYPAAGGLAPQARNIASLSDAEAQPVAEFAGFEQLLWTGRDAT